MVDSTGPVVVANVGVSIVCRENEVGEAASSNDTDTVVAELRMLTGGADVSEHNMMIFHKMANFPKGIPDG